MDERERAYWKRVFTIGPMIFIAAFWAAVGTYSIIGRLTVDAVLVFGSCTSGAMILSILAAAYELSQEKVERKWVKCSKCMGTGKVLAHPMLEGMVNKTENNSNRRQRE